MDKFDLTTTQYVCSNIFTIFHLFYVNIVLILNENENIVVLNSS